MSKWLSVAVLPKNAGELIVDNATVGKWLMAVRYIHDLFDSCVTGESEWRRWVWDLQEMGTTNAQTQMQMETKKEQVG